MLPVVGPPWTQGQGSSDARWHSACGQLWPRELARGDSGRGRRGWRFCFGPHRGARNDECGEARE
jgi:hypothetical protein